MPTAAQTNSQVLTFFMKIPNNKEFLDCFSKYFGLVMED